MVPRPIPASQPFGVPQGSTAPQGVPRDNVTEEDDFSAVPYTPLTLPTIFTVLTPGVAGYLQNIIDTEYQT